MTIRFEEEEKCPICKAIILPVYIASSIDTKDNASVYSYCRACKNTFITRYKYSQEINGHGILLDRYLCKKLYSEPNRIANREFDKCIINISVQFPIIYNQSNAAESLGLDEIAGLGYRKALEFLIKDLAIQEHPEELEEIKQMPLSLCINKYIDDKKIKTLAIKSAWIGNDEAHYLKKHENRDISDMKNFIDAILSYIKILDVTKDAESIEAK